MENKTKFYLSTSIAYASGIPHIGNVYEVILADAIARFKRLDGWDVFFQTGTDEHGQKIEQKASSKGVLPQEYVNYISSEIKRIYDLMQISYDRFIKTTNHKHQKAVQVIFTKLLQQGDIYLGKYQGLYSVTEEVYVSEKDLVDGKTFNGEIPILISEDTYFFKLAKYQNRLLDYLENNPNLIQPETQKKEILNLLKEPLNDLSISRTSFRWGIPVPCDKNHVIYVWIDALSNYLTGLDYNPNENTSSKFLQYWPCNLHVIGKDILRFHLIYWPILLMALKIELPQKFLAHPWILFDKNKMSKSKGNVLYVDDLLKFFPIDTIRYFVLHEIPYASDGNITYELLVERHNSVLVNLFGNVVHRIFGMLKSYRNYQLTQILDLPENHQEFDLSQKVLLVLPLMRQKFEECKVGEALEEVEKLARLMNKYIDSVKPWELAQLPEKETLLNYVLYSLTEALRFLGVLLKPFLPQTAEKILCQIQAEDVTFESLKTFGLLKTKKLMPDEMLFQRIDLENVLPQ
ncbi:Methionyl-tRNA synthetase [Candidatus Phytoplasma australiense]|uniref:Methionine--tRNA ligase n=2 Tax=Phytoplasma australiense TaxID=59748 RepID=B1V931_PHYAS|nr:methionine--tRNA ligase [Candidatus Phytoplasma australiense]AGL90774.1 Methionyl-tRNA synthetase [Strawberry lethal yellows phytoplasma (CPA) str. NZSb11]CAM11463.1 Methionyl-tRNA synthetase [Candidatus Phytoplasma australiense]